MPVDLYANAASTTVSSGGTTAPYVHAVVATDPDLFAAGRMTATGTRLIRAFIPPTVLETPAGQGALFARYKLPRGVSVLLLNGSYVQRRYPSSVDLMNATEAFIGGYEYPVSST